jgi:hypothetical protein
VKIATSRAAAAEALDPIWGYEEIYGRARKVTSFDENSAGTKCEDAPTGLGHALLISYVEARKQGSLV